MRHYVCHPRALYFGTLKAAALSEANYHYKIFVLKSLDCAQTGRGSAGLVRALLGRKDLTGRVLVVVLHHFL
jgi:hypothetical protein